MNKLEIKLHILLILVVIFISIDIPQNLAQSAEQVDYQELSWSPDGKKLSFTAYRDKNWDIYVMNADGTQVKKLTDAPANDSYSSWSPDSRKIAFASNRSGKFGIYIIDSDGTNLLKLTDDAADYAFPSWSPNGKQIAFMSKQVKGTWQIYVMNADGTNHKRLSNNKANDYNPAWSPDGSTIAFESDRDGNDADEIYTIKADGKKETRITNNNSEQVNDIFPTWISKNQISISAVKNRKVDIFIMQKDGSNRKLLLEHASYGRWSPDKSKIAYISQGNKDVPPQIFVMKAAGSPPLQLTK